MQKRKSLLERKKFISSVRHACRGMRVAFHEEQNVRIHTIFACVVLFFTLLIGVSDSEFIIIIFSITSVIVVEIINSIVERFSDMVKPQVSHLIATVKDMSAAAVLICALNACIVGAVIFLPKLVSFFREILF